MLRRGTKGGGRVTRESETCHSTFQLANSANVCVVGGGGGGEVVKGQKNNAKRKAGFQVYALNGGGRDGKEKEKSRHKGRKPKNWSKIKTKAAERGLCVIIER